MSTHDTIRILFCTDETNYHVCNQATAYICIKFDDGNPSPLKVPPSRSDKDTADSSNSVIYIWLHLIKYIMEYPWSTM